jgi:hypothetical protein
MVFRCVVQVGEAEGRGLVGWWCRCCAVLCCGRVKMVFAVKMGRSGSSSLLSLFMIYFIKAARRRVWKGQSRYEEEEEEEEEEKEEEEERASGGCAPPTGRKRFAAASSAPSPLASAASAASLGRLREGAGAEASA